MIPLSSISKARRYFTGEEIHTLHEETWPEPKAGLGAELQREVPQESTSHRGTVLVPGWSQDGQSITARST